MRGLRLIGVIGLCWPGMAAAAAGEGLSLSATVGLVSDYRFRGISLSDGQVAPQASLTVSHDSGAYAALWSSTLDGFGAVGGADVEIDASAGVRRPLAGGTADIGLLYYAYPGSAGGDYEFFEPYVSFSRAIGPVTAKIAAAFAPAQDALGGNSNLYLAADLAAPVPRTPLTLRGHVGRSSGRTPLSPSGEYLDWQLGVDLAWRNLTLGLSYVDTDLGAADALSAGAAKDIVDTAVVFSLAASF